MSRQKNAASVGLRQNPDSTSSGRLKEDAGRTPDSTPSVVMTPFGPFVQGAVPAAPAKSVAAPAAVSAPETAAPDSPPSPAATTPAAALDVVRAALRKANIEPSGLNLYYEEVPVYYPGGSYTNRQITLELSSGRKESYDVGLMLKNPWLTAFEIRRFMGYAA